MGGHSPAILEYIRCKNNAARTYKSPDDPEDACYNPDHTKIENEIREEEFVVTLGVRPVDRDVCERAQSKED